MKPFFLLLRYIRFLVVSGNEHSIHSPFIFNFYIKVIAPQKQYYIFKKIERLRRELFKSKEIIEVQDFGAGSAIHSGLRRKVGSIAKHSVKSAAIGQFLFKTVLYFHPKHIIELGTSLGLTTIYLAKADSTNRLISFEGCARTAEVAAKNFEKIKANNIRSILGNIDETLPANINYITKADLVFFDANHRYEPTMRYFQTCLLKAHEESIFIFDDIHWSTEMEKAWKEIISHPEVTLSIDFFFLGMIFFRKAQPKQHFNLRL